ncbi:MAG: ATP-binding protein [Methanomassiliicoccaceae archaeon]|nr:ATP-binding protein [Methanomassiliicoccaceae archaeon]
MLVDFTIENYGPFKDKAVLSLQATGLSEHEENLIKVESLKEDLLSSVAMFGPNASGKSYILRALSSLVRMMRFPLPANMGIIDYAPFRLSPHTKGAPTKMEIRFIMEGTLYHYSLSYNSNSILAESLYHYPNKQRAKVFDRNKGAYSFGSGGIAAGQKAISDKTAENSTYVSVAAQFNNSICLKVNTFVSNILILFGDMRGVLNQTIRMMESDEGLKQDLINALAVADFCINGIDGHVRIKDVIDLKDVLPPQVIGLMMAIGNQKFDETILNLRHDVEAMGVSEEDRTFPYHIESNGTIMMLSVMGPIIKALKAGGVIAIDEFGSFLHHEISRWIVNQFKSPGNKNNSQLIVNTHDQLLMDTEEIFRRDQICFTHKDRDSGASELYCLSDFNIRKSFDPRKGYELGRFGALPFIKGDDWLNG